LQPRRRTSRRTSKDSSTRTSKPKEKLLKKTSTVTKRRRKLTVTGDILTEAEADLPRPLVEETKSEKDQRTTCSMPPTLTSKNHSTTLTLSLQEEVANK